MDVLGHLHLHKAEETMMLREQFVVVSNDRAFLWDIGEGNTQDRAHFGEKMAELIQDDTEVVNWDFVLFIEDSVYLPEVILDVVEVELLRLFHLWI